MENDTLKYKTNENRMEANKNVDDTAEHVTDNVSVRNETEVSSEHEEFENTRRHFRQHRVKPAEDKKGLGNRPRPLKTVEINGLVDDPKSQLPKRDRWLKFKNYLTQNREIDREFLETVIANILKEDEYNPEFEYTWLKKGNTETQYDGNLEEIKEQKNIFPHDNNNNWNKKETSTRRDPLRSDDNDFSKESASNPTKIVGAIRGIVIENPKTGNRTLYQTWDNPSQEELNKMLALTNRSDLQQYYYRRLMEAKSNESTKQNMENRK
ncbi:unnamed protein product [Plutella xylostella]|uniref:(diamondback moth) hypothetical protein n=1 Tax=Plutella xylostella TaxID=51655 RepID=A0A8S4EJN7_PLUXY|nr:unnamed protein product [Plutella xylostella]